MNRAALTAATFATDADDLRRLLDMLGLLPQPTATKPVTPAHVRGHDGRRACYMRGCRLPQCCRANARYVKQWRAKGGCRSVTSRRSLLVVIDARTGRGRRAAYPGQLALIVEEAR